MKFVGLTYRAHDPRWSFKPLSGDGAAIHGGRFNPEGVHALYLTLDAMTAVKEASQGLACKFHPCVLCTCDVTCDAIVDLSTRSGRLKAGVLAKDIACPWFSYISRDAKPPSWTIAEMLLRNGAAGVLVPSYAPGAGPLEKNLVLWDWSAMPPHKVTGFDPSGRLPKNQLSWP